MLKTKLTALCAITVLTIASAGCPSSTAKKLAVASQSISHALLNAQLAARQGVTDGVISPTDEAQFETFLVKASQAGMVLDGAIRQNQSATDVSQQVNSFLDAFNQLNTQGLAGIKNKNLQLTISTILNGAETSVAIIVATVGGAK